MAPRARPRPCPYTKVSSGVLATRCGRLVTAQLEGPLETVDSLVAPRSKAAHRDGVCLLRTPFQHPWAVPVMNAEDRRKHTNECVRSRWSWRAELATLWREQPAGGGMGQILQGIEARQRQRKGDDSRGHCGAICESGHRRNWEVPSELGQW
jgi:hypothetical protein